MITQELTSRDVFLWEGGMFKFGGEGGEAQRIGVEMDIPFWLEGIVVREIIDRDNEIEEITRLSTSIEVVSFKPVSVTTVHPSTTAIEGVLNLALPTYSRQGINDTSATMTVQYNLYTEQETGRIELPA